VTATRDFLEGNISADQNLVDPADLLEIARLLKDIRRELYKQNPDVLATVEVQNAYQNQIADTNDHEVRFEVGGKPVPIYGLMAYSTYDVNVFVSIQKMSSTLDGIQLAANNVLVLGNMIDTMHVMLASKSGNGCYVNGPADATHGGVFLYGFTIPDYDRDRTRQ
jgi:hypothetical protein